MHQSFREHVLPGIVKASVAVCFLALVSGCETLQFYHQAARGQAGLLLRRTATDELLQSKIDPTLRDRIETAGQILDFASRIGLPASGVYQSYVETGEPYVVWNVFASKPYELTLRKSCFPVAGCVTYRGYFKREDADNYAKRLRNKGYEAYVGGVAAYSTLGWFNDPLLDTFLFRSDEQLAALLFHELAHRQVYVKDDTRFNESLATTIELHALEQWLKARGESHRFDRYRLSLARRDSVIELIMLARNRLKVLYDAGIPVAEMEQKKQSVFREMREAYSLLRETWADGDEFYRWMQGPMSNAKLETVADYNEWVPPLTAKLDKLGYEQFKLELSRLASMSQTERDAELGTFTSAGNTLR
jgi:predicted aminopeptidase